MLSRRITGRHPYLRWLMASVLSTMGFRDVRLRVLGRIIRVRVGDVAWGGCYVILLARDFALLRPGAQVQLQVQICGEGD
jgi:hypothetical protein